MKWKKRLVSWLILQNVNIDESSYRKDGNLTFTIEILNVCDRRNGEKVSILRIVVLLCLTKWASRRSGT